MCLQKLFLSIPPSCWLALALHQLSSFQCDCCLAFGGQSLGAVQPCLAPESHTTRPAALTPVPCCGPPRNMHSHPCLVVTCRTVPQATADVSLSWEATQGRCGSASPTTCPPCQHRQRLRHLLQRTRAIHSSLIPTRQTQQCPGAGRPPRLPQESPCPRVHLLCSRHQTE